MAPSAQVAGPSPMLDEPLSCSFSDSLAKICRTSRRFSCWAVTAAAFRSSAKLRILCKTGLNPSPLGSHHCAQEGSRNISAILVRRVMGWMYLHAGIQSVVDHVYLSARTYPMVSSKANFRRNHMWCLGSCGRKRAAMAMQAWMRTSTPLGVGGQNSKVSKYWHVA